MLCIQSVLRMLFSDFISDHLASAKESWWPLKICQIHPCCLLCAVCIMALHPLPTTITWNLTIHCSCKSTIEPYILEREYWPAIIVKWRYWKCILDHTHTFQNNFHAIKTVKAIFKSTILFNIKIIPSSVTSFLPRALQYALDAWKNYHFTFISSHVTSIIWLYFILWRCHVTPHKIAIQLICRY